MKYNGVEPPIYGIALGQDVLTEQLTPGWFARLKTQIQLNDQMGVFSPLSLTPDQYSELSGAFKKLGAFRDIHG